MLLLKLGQLLHLIDSKKYAKKRAIFLFKKSNLFDSDWYLKMNPKVKDTGLSPEEHYYQHGWKEGKNPGPIFDGNAYLEENPDVKSANICPLEHYLLVGKDEGRFYPPASSYQTYHNSFYSKESLREKICYFFEYPLRLKNECRRLEIEIEKLENDLK